MEILLKKQKLIYNYNIDNPHTNIIGSKCELYLDEKLFLRYNEKMDNPTDFNSDFVYTEDKGVITNMTLIIKSDKRVNIDKLSKIISDLFGYNMKLERFDYNTIVHNAKDFEDKKKLLNGLMHFKINWKELFIINE